MLTAHIRLGDALAVHLTIHGAKARESIFFFVSIVLTLIGLVRSVMVPVLESFVIILVGVGTLIFTLLYTRNAVVNMTNKIERDLFYLMNKQ